MFPRGGSLSAGLLEEKETKKMQIYLYANINLGHAAEIETVFYEE